MERRRALFDSIAGFLRHLLSSDLGEVLTVFLHIVGTGVGELTTVERARKAGCPKEHSALISE